MCAGGLIRLCSRCVVLLRSVPVALRSASVSVVSACVVQVFGCLICSWFTNAQYAIARSVTRATSLPAVT